MFQGIRDQVILDSNKNYEMCFTQEFLVSFISKILWFIQFIFGFMTGTRALKRMGGETSACLLCDA